MSHHDQQHPFESHQARTSPRWMPSIPQRLLNHQPIVRYDSMVVCVPTTNVKMAARELIGILTNMQSVIEIRTERGSNDSVIGFFNSSSNSIILIRKKKPFPEENCTIQITTHLYIPLDSDLHPGVA
jgi:hypothetical protein